MRYAIDSALAQTYKNIEILVINDGSNDNGKTEAIALSYGNKIRYIYKINGGCATALNTGLKNMRGEYFSWLSHDDIYEPDKISNQIAILTNLSNKNTILYAGYHLINTDSEFIATIRPEEKASIEKLNISLYPLMNSLINGCTLLIPFKYFKEIGFFDENLVSTHDYALWYEFLKVAPIRFDKKISVKYRSHPTQSTHTIKTHANECENFWITILKTLSRDQMIEMEGSVEKFLEKKLLSFQLNAYNDAYLFAKNLLSVEKSKRSRLINYWNSLILQTWKIINVFSRLLISVKQLGLIQTYKKVCRRLARN